jgi:hypothetical protein
MDATVPGLAQQNTQAGTSLLARLMKAAQDARLQTVNQLAARGILSSGETGYQLGELALAQKQAEYDARTGVLSQLNELQAGNASAELARKLAEIDAAMAAYGRQSSNPANTGLGGMYPVGGGGFSTGPHHPAGASAALGADPQQVRETVADLPGLGGAEAAGRHTRPVRHLPAEPAAKTGDVTCRRKTSSGSRG